MDAEGADFAARISAKHPVVNPIRFGGRLCHQSLNDVLICLVVVSGLKWLWLAHRHSPFRWLARRGRAWVPAGSLLKSSRRSFPGFVPRERRSPCKPSFRFSVQMAFKERQGATPAPV